MEIFDAYFRRADLDMDGRISGAEAVAFFQGSNLPKHILAQIWMHADKNKTGFLGRPEFYNALKLVTVAQSGRELTEDIVKAAFFGPAAAKIPPPQINPVSAPAAQMNSMTTSTPQLGSMVSPSTQMSVVRPTSQNLGFRGPQALPNVGMSQQFLSTSGNQFMRPPQTSASAASPPVQGANQGPSVRGNRAGPHLPSSNTPNLSNEWLGSSISGGSIGGTSQLPTRGVTPPVNQGGFGLALSGATPVLPPRPQAASPLATSGPPNPLDQVLPPLQPTAKDSKSLVVSGNGISTESFFGGDVFSAALQAKSDASVSTLSASAMPSVFSIASVTAGSQNSIKPGQLDPLPSISTRPLGGIQLQQAQPLVMQNQLDTMQNTSALTSSQISVRPAGSVASQSQLQWPRITQSDIQKYTAVFVEVDKDRDGKITGEQARNLFLSWRLPREVLKQVWDLSDHDNDSMLSLREFCTALYLMERYREGRPLPAVLPNSLRFDETLLQATGQPSTAYGGPAWQTSSGLSQLGIPGSGLVMPTSGIRPPIQTSIATQIDGVVNPLQQKSRVPSLEKDLQNQHNKVEQDVLKSKFQEATEEGKKVQELEKILDSREKIEFYRTKMQELVLYKSRCDNRLNEITERASADKHEAESLAKKYEEKYKQVADVASKLTVEEATFRHIQERKLELHNAIIKMEQGGSVDGLLQVRADRIQSDLEELAKALNERCKQHGLHVKSTASIELPFGWQPGIQEEAVDWDEDWDKFEDEGFSIAKELSVEVENVGTPEKSKSPSVWSEKTSMDEVSPVASSSHFHGKAEKPYSTGEYMTESGSAHAQSEDGSARSPPDSPGRSAFESPSREFHSPQFGMHDISPRAKDSHSDHGGADSTISGDKYADEPSWGITFDTNDVDSVWGFGAKDTGDERSSENSFFGSGDFGLNPIKVDSPSAGSVFEKEKSSFFADSVPSTPLFNSATLSKFNDGPEDHSFDNSSIFDSFSMHDGSGFFPQRESLTRFDSISSTNNFDHSRGFSSFDDSDPFGSTGPFKSSESHSPRRGSDNWGAF